MAARHANDGYPFDFDASLRNTRGDVDHSMHPYPQMIGSLNSGLPLFDAKQVLPMNASSGFGLMVGVIETDTTPFFASNTVMGYPKNEG